MILIFELICLATGHAASNSATIQTIAQSFPNQSVRVFAHISHTEELQADPVLTAQANVSFQPVEVSSHFRFRPQIVSFRRGWRELLTILSALRQVPKREPCLVLLISATSTAIFAASLLAWLSRRTVRVQVGLHGNLNDAFGWRTRNPIIRSLDLRSALVHGHGGRVRFLVLENALRASLGRRIPGAEQVTDVLPMPVSPAEAWLAEPMTLAKPLRLGLVGQATEAKGIRPFLALAHAFRVSHPDAITFHVVGNAPAGSDLQALAVIGEPVPTQHIPRDEFIAKLARLHYVCLLVHPSYYELSASGALADAILWLRPVIAMRVPIIASLFDQFGDIGELCDTQEDVQAAIARLVDTPDPARYDRQVANLRRLRASRMPSTLATSYRGLIVAGFPGLLENAG